MKNFLLTFLAFISPIFPLAFLIIIASIVDTFVGRWYARKINIEVTSRKTRLGFTRKLLIYNGGLLFTYGVDYFMFNQITQNYVWFDFFTTKFIASFILYIEYTSIDEKIKWVYGKGITDRIKEFINTLKKLITIKNDIKY
jgi:hypothetical protein